MNNITKRIELFSNIAVIILAILIGATFIKGRLFSDHSDSVTEGISPGTHVSLPDTDWTKNDLTLLVVLQKGCHFCSESAQFYQRLAHQAEGAQNIQLIAVLPQDTNTSRRYLDDLNVPINNIKQAPLQTLKVRGTPTLILVNNKGDVTDSWIGKLPPDKEAEVLRRLQERQQ